MKKIMILACVCMAFVFSGCHREQHTYKASVTEYSFADHDNEVALKAVLGNLSSFWDGDYTWKGDVVFTDLKADARFTLESNLAISTSFDKKLRKYFDVDDYFIYTLMRVEDSTILHQYKYTINGEEELLNVVGD